MRLEDEYRIATYHVRLRSARARRRPCGICATCSVSRRPACRTGRPHDRHLAVDEAAEAAHCMQRSSHRAERRTERCVLGDEDAARRRATADQVVAIGRQVRHGGYRRRDVEVRDRIAEIIEHDPDHEAVVGKHRRADRAEDIGQRRLHSCSGRSCRSCSDPLDRLPGTREQFVWAPSSNTRDTRGGECMSTSALHPGTFSAANTHERRCRKRCRARSGLGTDDRRDRSADRHDEVVGERGLDGDSGVEVVDRRR